MHKLGPREQALMGQVTHVDDQQRAGDGASPAIERGRRSPGAAGRTALLRLLEPAAATKRVY